MTNLTTWVTQVTFRFNVTKFEVFWAKLLHCMRTAWALCGHHVRTACTCEETHPRSPATCQLAQQSSKAHKITTNT